MYFSNICLQINDFKLEGTFENINLIPNFSVPFKRLSIIVA